METISIRFQEDVIKKIDTSIGTNNFNSRTEFIREAVRDKLNSLKKSELMQDFLKLHGKSKLKTSYKDNRKTREIVSKDLMEELACMVEDVYGI